MIDFLQIGVPALNKLMIQMEGIVKRFGSITALDNMNFHAYGGEITAIVGDNGSGKSTLIQILTGCLKPDQGVIQIKDRVFHSLTAKEAMEQGITAVYQNGDIMIFDEPTSAMGMKETERIMNLFRTLKKQGKTIILISHNLFQVYDISDRICVIKNGRQVDFFLTRDSSPEQLYQSIIEREEQADDEKMDE